MRPADSPLSIFLCFLRLGLTSFGGPIAHLGYFRDEFVGRRAWLSESAYARLVALCQLLPGPASSQVGIGLGLMRGGYAGALAAWLGFTAPSAIALMGFGMVAVGGRGPLAAGALHGLLVVAVAVVAQALWAMGRTLCNDAPRASIAVAGALLAFALPGPLGQALVIAGGAVCGLLALRVASTPVVEESAASARVSRRVGLIALILLVGLLIFLPVLARASGWYPLMLIDRFFRTGATVFGGGHVVLPLLQSAVVPPGWISNDAFLAGYGMAQAVPGPLFTFAAYLGSAAMPTPHGWLGGSLTVIAIFLPSFLLVFAALPFLDTWNRHPAAARALAGINAAVVGLLLAAFYTPVWTSGITSARDFGLAMVALVLLMFWKWPPWIVVLVSGAAGTWLAM